MASDTSILPSDLTDAEKRALDATQLSAFPINLMEVRRTVQLVLSEFGKHGFFDQYTVHDFSHCLEMLRMLDWIIPDETKSKMSPKQNAVTSVRAKIARDKEGRLDPNATKHEIEIHALFNDGDGFFGIGVLSAFMIADNVQIIL